MARSRVTAITTVGRSNSTSARSVGERLAMTESVVGRAVPGASDAELGRLRSPRPAAPLGMVRGVRSPATLCAGPSVYPLSWRQVGSFVSSRVEGSTEPGKEACHAVLALFSPALHVCLPTCDTCVANCGFREPVASKYRRRRRYRNEPRCSGFWGRRPTRVGFRPRHLRRSRRRMFYRPWRANAVEAGGRERGGDRASLTRA
jgi:hypothetical protein